MDGFGGLIFFFGPQFSVAGLDILADHDQRHKKELNDIGDENQENERKGVKRAFGNGLEEHPAKDKQHKEIDGVHGTDGGGDGDGYFIVQLEAALVFEIDVFWNSAIFEVFV